MIVFDLRCGDGHVFEAWFGSSAAFEAQRADGLIACPMCGAVEVEKAVMAPNVAPKGNRAAADTPPPPAKVKAALAAMAQAQAKALATSEWVGSGFAAQARAMHDGDVPDRPIHGQATLADAKALVEDGVPIAPLPFPVVPPEACN
jgi:hypothetical protein